MKTSNISAYNHIEQITASSNNILQFRALYITTNGSLMESQQIVGTSWEKDASGSYKSMTYISDISRFSNRNEIAQISFRTITSIPASVTVYGLR